MGYTSIHAPSHMRPVFMNMTNEYIPQTVSKISPSTVSKLSSRRIIFMTNRSFPVTAFPKLASIIHGKERHTGIEPEECVIRFETPRLPSASDGLKTRPHSKCLPRIQQRQQQQQPAGTMKRVECCIMTNHILFSTVTASTNLCERKDQDLSIY